MTKFHVLAHLTIFWAFLKKYNNETFAIATGYRYLKYHVLMIQHKVSNSKCDKVMMWSE